MKFEDITEDFYQSIIRYASLKTDYIGYCIPVIVKKNFYGDYLVYGLWMPTINDAIRAYENSNLTIEQIVQFNILDSCEIYYDTCQKCNKKKDDIEKRFNSYDYDVNNKPKEKCWEIMCKECAQNLADDI